MLAPLLGPRRGAIAALVLPTIYSTVQGMHLKVQCPQSISQCKVA